MALFDFNRDKQYFCKKYWWQPVSIASTFEVEEESQGSTEHHASEREGPERVQKVPQKITACSSEPVRVKTRGKSPRRRLATVGGGKPDGLKDHVHRGVRRNLK